MCAVNDRQISKPTGRNDRQLVFDDCSITILALLTDERVQVARGIR